MGIRKVMAQAVVMVLIVNTNAVAGVVMELLGEGVNLSIITLYTILEEKVELLQVLMI